MASETQIPAFMILMVAKRYQQRTFKFERSNGTGDGLGQMDISVQQRYFMPHEVFKLRYTITLRLVDYQCDRNGKSEQLAFKVGI